MLTLSLTIVFAVLHSFINVIKPTVVAPRVTDSFKVMEQIPQSYMVTEIGEDCEGSNFSVTWTSYSGHMSKTEYQSKIVSVLKSENIGSIEVVCKQQKSKHTYEIGYRACTFSEFERMTSCTNKTANIRNSALWGTYCFVKPSMKNPCHWNAPPSMTECTALGSNVPQMCFGAKSVHNLCALVGDQAISAQRLKQVFYGSAEQLTCKNFSKSSEYHFAVYLQECPQNCERSKLDETRLILSGYTILANRSTPLCIVYLGASRLMSSVRIVSSLNDLVRGPVTFEDVNNEISPADCQLLQNLPFRKVIPGAFGDVDVEFVMSSDKAKHQSVHIWFRFLITELDSELTTTSARPPATLNADYSLPIYEDLFAVEKAAWLHNGVPFLLFNRHDISRSGSEVRQRFEVIEPGDYTFEVVLKIYTTLPSAVHRIKYRHVDSILILSNEMPQTIRQSNFGVSLLICVLTLCVATFFVVMFVALYREGQRKSTTG